MTRQKRKLERRRKSIKNRGFTDRLYFANLIFAWLFLLTCVTLTILSGKYDITDLSIISYGIPAVYGELAVHTSFIIWKAKNENIRKFGKVKERSNENDLCNVYSGEDYSRYLDG